MNIAYFGSPILSAELLDSLFNVNTLDIKLIVTQPDKPAGKSLSMKPTAVKTCAQTHTTSIFDKSLDEISEKALIDLFHMHNIDLGIVFAYGVIIPQNVLKSTQYGFWNIHPSLLPLYRGASPTIFPILLGDTKTGITLIQMNEEMDQGDIIGQKEIQIQDSASRIDIERQIAPIATKMVAQAVDTLQKNGTIEIRPQIHKGATYTRRITKQDGYAPFELIKDSLTGGGRTHVTEQLEIVSWYYGHNKLLTTPVQNPAKLIWNMYRTLVGWPGIWTTINTNRGKKRLKIVKMNFDGRALSLETVQLEGKNEVSFQKFNKAYNII